MFSKSNERSRGYCVFSNEITHIKTVPQKCGILSLTHTPRRNDAGRENDYYFSLFKSFLSFKTCKILNTKGIKMAETTNSKFFMPQHLCYKLTYRAARMIRTSVFSMEYRRSANWAITALVHWCIILRGVRPSLQLPCQMYSSGARRPCWCCHQQGIFKAA